MPWGLRWAWGGCKGGRPGGKGATPASLVTATLTYTGHSPIGEPLSLLALKNVAVKGHTQGQIKGMVDSGSPVIGLLNLVEP